MLLSKGVEECRILFLSLIAAPEGIRKLCSTFPRLKVITSDIDDGIGPDFQVVPGRHSVSPCLLFCCLPAVTVDCNLQSTYAIAQVLLVGTLYKCMYAYEQIQSRSLLARHLTQIGLWMQSS